MPDRIPVERLRGQGHGDRAPGRGRVGAGRGHDRSDPVEQEGGPRRRPPGAGRVLGVHPHGVGSVGQGGERDVGSPAVRDTVSAGDVTIGVRAVHADGVQEVLRRDHVGAAGQHVAGGGDERDRRRARADGGRGGSPRGRRTGDVRYGRQRRARCDDVEAAVAVHLVGAVDAEVVSGPGEGGSLLVGGEPGGASQEQGEGARRVGGGDRGPRERLVETEPVGGEDPHPGCYQVREGPGPATATGRPAAAGRPDRRVVEGTDGQRLRVVGRADLVPAPCPKLPAANTGRIPAARSACTSGWKARSQPGPAPSDHDPFTTSGASVVSGSPSGSSTHWKAWWTAVVVAAPWSSKIRAAIQVASGATPMERLPRVVTAEDHAHRRRPVAGEVGGKGRVLAVGSYQLLVPPRQRPARSGWVPSTPLSRVATTTPVPVSPSPDRWCLNRSDVGLGGRGSGDQGRLVARDGRHLRSGRELGDDSRCGGDGHRVDDPQRRHRVHLALRRAGAQETAHRCLVAVGPGPQRAHEATEPDRAGLTGDGGRACLAWRRCCCARRRQAAAARCSRTTSTPASASAATSPAASRGRRAVLTACSGPAGGPAALLGRRHPDGVGATPGPRPARSAGSR